MKLYNISLNNLRRRKFRAFFLIAGLMIGITSIVALLSTIRILEDDIGHKMDEYGANIVISPKSEGLSLNYGGLNLGGVSFDVKEIPEEDIKNIWTIKNSENIRIVSPKVFGVFEEDNGSTISSSQESSTEPRKVMAVGVDFNSEFNLKRWWKLTGEKPSGDSDIIVGHEAGSQFGLTPGMKKSFMGREFTVTGVLEATGSQDDTLFFMPLKTAQDLFQKQGKIAMVEVAAQCGNCPIEEIVRQLSAMLPNVKVTAVQQVVKSRMDTLASLRKLSLAISAIVLAIGSMVVFVTMTASVNERTREIGIFSAIGFRRSHIIRIILLEALIVSSVAGILGYLVGIAGTRLLVPFFVEQLHHFSPDPSLAVGALFLSVLTGILASIYPAVSASKMDPSEALRTL